MKEKIEQKKKRNWWPLGFGVAALSTLSYFGWEYWKSKKRAIVHKEDAPEEKAPDPADYAPKNETSYNSSISYDAPIIKGSKGERVRQIQLALIEKYGSGILPKYGADGDFGSETVNALKKVGLPEVITQEVFNQLVEKKTIDPFPIAKGIYDAIKKMDIVTTLSLLKGIKGTENYKAVSDAFQSFQINGVRQTLVNGVLNAFPDERLKQMIRTALSAIGLKYDGEKWSLSGLGSVRYIITTRPGRVYKNSTEYVNVKPNTVLGREVAKRGSFTVFENDNRNFLIENSSIKYYGS